MIDEVQGESKWRTFDAEMEALESSFMDEWERHLVEEYEKRKVPPPDTGLFEFFEDPGNWEEDEDWYDRSWARDDLLHDCYDDYYDYDYYDLEWWDDYHPCDYSSEYDPVVSPLAFNNLGDYWNEALFPNKAVKSVRLRGCKRASRYVHGWSRMGEGKRSLKPFKRSANKRFRSATKQILKGNSKQLDRFLPLTSWDVF
ncbi:MAG: hypothetical protein KDH96_05755 [Candidatus Riesia sp.]|nr:hypothetical protein [Candidatus Riesia sp.]